MMRSGLSLLLISWLTAQCGAQIAWTPIYVDGSSQVDLWTQSTSGCACPWDNKLRNCACCVKDGACPCGKEAPTRCAQCGLEAHCSNMCNMTIDARLLRNKSSRTSGQIKSPALEGPTSCIYKFQPAAGQRVEIQLYRLVAVGHHNGTSCIGGALRLESTELCGVNERYTPPVVLFSDHGDTSLIFDIKEKTSRSQFLAYYSFTALSNTQGVGFQPRGGTRILHTECDWLYQDVSCRVRGACVAASPGYPGLYPPRARCLHLIATSSVHTRVRLNFTAVLFPRGRCLTDFLALYQGASPTDPLLAKVCESKPTFLEFSGPNLLLEFSSGDHVPPYDYNGFMASIEFYERPVTTSAPVYFNNSISNAHDLPQAPPPQKETGRGSKTCELYFSADRDGRSGSFDTRALPFNLECRITFTGKHTDVVHISIFNYKLRAPSCRSVIEVIDGEWAGEKAAGGAEKPLLQKLCSPVSRQARDGSGRFVEPGTLVSKGRSLTLVLRRTSPQHQSPETEYVDGAFMFHDEQVSGTLQPGGLCEAQYYGASSPATGSLTSPASAPLFWNVDGPLKCRHNFVPAANQSVTITIQSLGRVSHDSHCVTACGDSGCQCRTALLSLDKLDHLLLLSEGDQVAACLCGNFRSEWLPVALRSWSGVQLVYSVGHYTWSAKGFTFGASYQFSDDALCGHHTVTTHSGEIYSRNLTSMGSINNFYHQHCTWILDSNVERQLFIDISTNQSRPCVAWNITIHEYSATAEDQHHAGNLIHTFCPRDTRKQFELPWRLNTVVVRVLAMTRTAPMYMVKWKSKAAMGGPAPAAAALAPHSSHANTRIFLLQILLILLFYNSPITS